MSREGAFPLHAELPWFGYASEGAVLTKRGELLAGARLQGAPFECRAADDLDSVALRWTLALKSLAPGWRIRWHARKRRLAALPQRVAGDALSARAQNTRNAALIGKGLYSIEASVFWLWDPRLSPQPPREAGAGWARSLVAAAGLWLSPDRTRRLLAGQVADACERFESAVAAFRGLVDDVTPLEPLRCEDLFRDLALSANSRKAAETARSLGADGLDRQLALSDLEAYRDHLLVDDERVETYALLDPPSVTRAHLFGGILDLDAELDLAAEWRREDTASSGRRIRGARRHYHQKRYSMMAHASGDSASPQARGALEDRAAEAEADQLGEALRELEVEGLPFGDHSLGVALRGGRPGELDAVRPELLRIAAAADARFHREVCDGAGRSCPTIALQLPVCGRGSRSRAAMGGAGGQCPGRSSRGRALGGLRDPPPDAVLLHRALRRHLARAGGGCDGIGQELPAQLSLGAGPQVLAAGVHPRSGRLVPPAH